MHHTAIMLVSAILSLALSTQGDVIHRGSSPELIEGLHQFEVSGTVERDEIDLPDSVPEASEQDARTKFWISSSSAERSRISSYNLIVIRVTLN